MKTISKLLIMALLGIIIATGCKKENETPAETCSDGIQNQNETGIDCGGSCAACPHYIGESFGGGIVFYIDGTGQHGLIAPTVNQSETAEWGCFGTLITGATDTAIYAGALNTTNIVNGCSTAGIAARICDTLTLNGYTDWYLPSKQELNLLYAQRNVVGGFYTTIPYSYWCSTQHNVNTANWGWWQNFSTGAQAGNGKAATCKIRAVRDF